MMTRQEASAWQAKLFPAQPPGGARPTLLDICQSLRSGVNGSADEWKPENIREVVGMLRATLDTWRPSLGKLTCFDDAVHRLIDATLTEVISYDWWQEKGRGTVYTHDLSEELEALIDRLRLCDGKNADAAVVVWEQCGLLVVEFDRMKAALEAPPCS